MEENKIDCKECTRRYDRVTGKIQCGIKQCYVNKVKMCLTQHATLGLYWWHDKSKNETFFNEDN